MSKVSFSEEQTGAKFSGQVGSGSVMISGSGSEVAISPVPVSVSSVSVGSIRSSPFESWSAFKIMSVASALVTGFWG